MKKLNLFQELLVLFYTLYTAQAQLTLYIASDRDATCWPTPTLIPCDGTYTRPYDSFKYLLNTYGFVDNVIYNIVFLGRRGTTHYILPSETGYYNNTGFQEYFPSFNNIKFVLKPAYCDDTYIVAFDPLSLNCVGRTAGSVVTLAFKTLNFTIYAKSITIQDLIIDGSDLIFTSDSECMSVRDACCTTNCVGNVTFALSGQTMNGIFNTQTFYSTNVIFQNLFSLNNNPLVSFTTTITMSMSTTIIMNCTFPQGIISNFRLTSDYLATSSSITVINSLVSNYNNIDILTKTPVPAYEGYFLNLPMLYVGSISIVNSAFQNMANSYLQDSCTDDPLFPISNTLNSYMADVYLQSLKNKQSYSTGVIAMKSLQGSLTINACSFYNIVGYSGTVLSLMEMMPYSSVSITSNSIVENYALSNSATIKIYQSPGGTDFANSLNCQPITISSNYFYNNTGCPGAAGNVIISCATTLSGSQYLNPSTSSPAISTYTTFFNSNQNKLQITGNQFLDNSLIFSNSFLIYGFTGVLISNNNFTGNSIQTPSDYLASGARLLSSIQFRMLKPKPKPKPTTPSSGGTTTPTLDLKLFDFQATTVLYISLCTQITISSNYFNKNWGMNTTTTLRGSQITLDNTIVIGSTSVNIKSNTFINNQGVPDSVAIDNIAYNYTITTGVPLITLSLANVDNYLAYISSTTNEIVFDTNNFTNNTFNYMVPYSFGQAIIGSINNYVSIIRIYDDNDKNFGQPGWLTTVTDSKVQLTIKNSVFQYNKIVTTFTATGYFIVNYVIQKILIQNCQFLKNRILTRPEIAKAYLPGTALTNICDTDSEYCYSFPFTGTDTAYILRVSVGLIGIYTKSALNSYVNVTGCNFTTNTGTLFNGFIDIGYTFTLNITNNTITTLNPYSGQGKFISWKRTNGDVIIVNNTLSSLQNIELIMEFIQSQDVSIINNNLVNPIVTQSILSCTSCRDFNISGNNFTIPRAQLTLMTFTSARNIAITNNNFTNVQNFQSFLVFSSVNNINMTTNNITTLITTQTMVIITSAYNIIMNYNNYTILQTTLSFMQIGTANDITMIYNNFTSSYVQVMLVQGSLVHNVNMTYNNITTAPLFQAIAQFGSAYDITMIYNNFTSVQTQQNSLLFPSAHNVNITCNNFTNLITQQTLMYAMTINDITINYNNFTNVQSQQINLRVTACNNANINYNKFSNIQTPQMIILFNSVVNAILTYNSFATATNIGTLLYIASGNDITLTYSNFTSVTSTSTIMEFDSIRDITLTYNNFNTIQTPSNVMFFGTARNINWNYNNFTTTNQAQKIVQINTCNDVAMNNNRFLTSQSIQSMIKFTSAHDITMNNNNFTNTQTTQTIIPFISAHNIVMNNNFFLNTQTSQSVLEFTTANDITMTNNNYTSTQVSQNFVIFTTVHDVTFNTNNFANTLNLQIFMQLVSGNNLVINNNNFANTQASQGLMQFTSAYDITFTSNNFTDSLLSVTILQFTSAHDITFTSNNFTNSRPSQAVVTFTSANDITFNSNNFTNSQNLQEIIQFYSCHNIVLNHNDFTNSLNLQTIIHFTTVNSVTSNTNTFINAQNLQAIIKFTPGPHIYTEQGNTYKSIYLTLALKYLYADQSLDSVLNTNYASRPWSHTSTSSVYQTITIVASSIPNIGTVSAIIACIANNVQLTFTDTSPTFVDVTATYAYLIANHTTYTADSIDFLLTNTIPISFIRIANSTMTITNSKMVSYSSIDSLVLQPGGILSPYFIQAVNTQITMRNIWIGMYMNILTAKDCGTITFENVTSKANFDIKIPLTLFKGFTFDPIFYIQNSIMSINGSSFSANNAFLNASSTKLSFNSSSVSDGNDNSLTSWVSDSNQVYNTSLNISYSKLSQLSSNFNSKSSNITFNQSAIWGYLNNPELSIEVDMTILNFINTLFTCVKFAMSTKALSTVNINGIIFNTAQISLTILNADFSMIGIIPINSLLTVSAINSTVHMDYTISIQSVDPATGLTFTTPYNYLFPIFGSLIAQTQQITSKVNITLQNSSIYFTHLIMQSSTLSIQGTLASLSLIDGIIGSGDINFQLDTSPLIYDNVNLTDTSIKVNAINSPMSVKNTQLSTSGSHGNMIFNILDSSLIIDNINCTNSNLNIQSDTSNLTINNIYINQTDTSTGIIITLIDNPIAIIHNAKFIRNNYFTLRAVNSTVNMTETLVDQLVNDTGTIIQFNYTILNMANCKFSDNIGALTILGSNKLLFDNVSLAGKGPYINSGGISVSIFEADLTWINSRIEDNYATITLRSANITMRNHVIIENFNSSAPVSNDFGTVTTITSLFLFSQCNVLIENVTILNSNQVISSYNSYLNLTGILFQGHVKQKLLNDLFKFMSGNIGITNCTYKNYDIQVALLSLETPKKFSMNQVIFLNNTINSSYAISLYNPGNTSIDTLIIDESNKLIKSKEIEILLANGQIVNILNSKFHSVIDASSYHLYFKTHVSTTSLINCSFEANGISLFSSSVYILMIDNCQIIGNDSTQFTNDTTPNQLITIEHNSLVVVNNSIFEGIVTYIGIFNIKFLTRDEFYFQNTTFRNNRALYGSAINSNYFGNESLILIQNSTFYNNSANVLRNLTIITPDESGYGGAIYFNCYDELFCNMTIKNSTFKNNTANITAGALFSNYFPPFIDLETVVFDGNSAPYGIHISSNPIQFVILSPNSSSLLTGNLDWESLYFAPSRRNRVLQDKISSMVEAPVLVSGKIMSSFLEIYTLDIYQQVAGSDTKTEITITFNHSTYEPSTFDKETPTIPPTTNLSRIKIENGVYTYDNVLLSFWPGSNTTAVFTVHNLGRLPPYISGRIEPSILQQMSAALDMSFHYRNCIMGEVFLDNGVCYPCSKGYFSLVITNNSKAPCEECDYEVSACLGSEKVAPKPKYWRKNESASLVLKCPIEDACLGSPTNVTLYNATGICADGYSGNLCNTCPKGSVNSDNSCVMCRSNIWYYARLVLIILVQGLLIALSVKATVESLQKLTDDDKESNKKASNDLQSAVSMKILTNFIQIISIIRLFEFNWPTILTSLVSINEQIGGNSLQFFSIDCILLYLFPDAGDNLTYIKYLAIFIMPFACTLIATLIWLTIYYMRKQRPYDKRGLMKRILTTIVILNFNFQPNLILYSLLIFQCQNLYRKDLPEYYLTSNYQIQCYIKDYNIRAIPIGIVNLSLWGIIFPLGIFIYLKNNEDKLHTEEVKSKFSFLYDGYKYEKFYWEQIVLIRKIILIGIYVFIRLISVKIQAWFLFITLFCSLILQLKNQPLLTNELNTLEEKAQFCNVIVAFAALYYMLGPGSNYLDVLVLVLCLCTNVWFLTGWMLFYLRMQWSNIKENPIVARLKNYYTRKHSKVYMGNLSKDASKLINSNNNDFMDPPSPTAYKDPSSNKYDKELLDINSMLSKSRLEDSPEKFIVEQGLPIIDIQQEISLDSSPQKSIQTTKTFDHLALARIKIEPRRKKRTKPKSIDIGAEIQNIIELNIETEKMQPNTERSNGIDVYDGQDLKSSSRNKLNDNFETGIFLNHLSSDVNMLSGRSIPTNTGNPNQINFELDLERIAIEQTFPVYTEDLADHPSTSPMRREIDNRNMEIRELDEMEHFDKYHEEEAE